MDVHYHTRHRKKGKPTCGRDTPSGTGILPVRCSLARRFVSGSANQVFLKLGEFLAVRARSWTNAKPEKCFGLRRHDAALLRRDASRRRKRGHVRALQKIYPPHTKGQAPPTKPDSLWALARSAVSGLPCRLAPCFGVRLRLGKSCALRLTLCGWTLQFRPQSSVGGV